MYLFGNFITNTSLAWKYSISWNKTEGYLLLTAKDSQEQGSWANQGFETCVSKWIYFLHFDQLNPAQHSESTIFLHYLNGRNTD